MAVYVSNLTVNTGTTFSQIFTLESADTNSATDLTGFTATAQMRKHPGASTADQFKEYQFSVDDLDEFTGFKIKIVSSGTNEALAPRFKDFRTLALA